MAKYIDKSALVAEIDRQKIGYNVNGKHFVEYDVTRKIIDIINTLEVKEDTISSEPLISSELLTASADYAREQLANPDYPTYNDEYELLCAFEAGANWQKEQAIDKACEFIETYPHLFMGVLRSEVIEDFKKYMEE